MSPTAIRRASKQATTSVREHVCPDELPWPTLHSFDTSYVSRDSMQELLDHWNPTTPVRICKGRDWGEGKWRTVEALEDLTPYGYVRMVGKSYTSVIVIESDSEGGLVTYEDLKAFPIPPAYVGLRTSWAEPEKRGRWYGVWLLKEAVTSPGSFDYLRRVRPAMIKALGADKGFGEATLARSPFYTGADADYSWAHLHSHKVTLTDLRIATEDFQRDFGAPVPTKGSDSGRYPVETLPGFDDQSESVEMARTGHRSTHELWQRNSEGTIQRNCSLFDACRRYAYGVAAGGVAVQESDLVAWMASRNRELSTLDASESLDMAEVETIARSIARWVNSSRFYPSRFYGQGTGSRWTPEQRRAGGRARAAQESAAAALAEGRKRSIEVRSTGVELRRVLVKKHLEEGLTTKEIAKIERVTARTIQRDVEALERDATGSRGPEPTDRGNRCRIDSEPSEKESDPISDESPEDEQGVENVEPESDRVSETPSGSPENPLRRPETRRDRGRRLREELRASDPDDTIWW